MSKLKDAVDKLPKQPFAGTDGGLAWAKREYENLVDLQKAGMPVSAIKRIREIWFQAYQRGEETALSRNPTYAGGKSDTITRIQILLDQMNRELYDASKSE